MAEKVPGTTNSTQYYELSFCFMLFVWRQRCFSAALRPQSESTLHRHSSYSPIFTLLLLIILLLRCALTLPPPPHLHHHILLRAGFHGNRAFLCVDGPMQIELKNRGGGGGGGEKMMNRKEIRYFLRKRCPAGPPSCISPVVSVNMQMLNLIADSERPELQNSEIRFCLNRTVDIIICQSFWENLWSPRSLNVQRMMKHSVKRVHLNRC